jgi:transcriptional regulator with XRE-family HTH domain
MEILNIGSRIKKMRIQAGFSQTVIAEYLHVDQSLISKIENGEREASTDILKKLSELFGCNVSTFVNQDEDISCLNVAFRTNGISSEDLNSISVINRIALNLENMQRMLRDK